MNCNAERPEQAGRTTHPNFQTLAGFQCCNQNTDAITTLMEIFAAQCRKLGTWRNVGVFVRFPPPPPAIDLIPQALLAVYWCFEISA